MALRDSLRGAGACPKLGANRKSPAEAQTGTLDPKPNNTRRVRKYGLLTTWIASLHPIRNHGHIGPAACRHIR